MKGEEENQVKVVKCTKKRVNQKYALEKGRKISICMKIVVSQNTNKYLNLIWCEEPAFFHCKIIVF